MSYDINSTDMISGELYIHNDDLYKWADSYMVLPARHFLTDVSEMLPNGWHRINTFDWSGVGSGYAYFELLPNIIADLRGEAEIIFIWEGGDHVSGLRIKDGKATEHNKVGDTFVDEGKPFGGIEA